PNSDPAHPFAAARKAFLKPSRQGTVRLVSQPQPSQFDHQSSNPSIFGFADALFPFALSPLE
ncbi:MAG: hypothetical protein L0Y39_12740, partial [Methylococcaceae bacterium]|nr:hypothetical protein [Methylococcaceae bacterium]